MVAGVGRLAVGGVACLAIGCAGPPPTAAPAPPALVSPSQTGLVAERWRLPRDTNVVEEVFALATPETSNTDPDAIATMRRDGFRCAVGPRDAIERLLRARTTDGLAGRTWHGEATTWRSLIGRRTQRGTILLVDGRARRLPESVVSIEIRGWSLPTPRDAALHVQLVPVVTTNAKSPIDATPTRPGRIRGTPLATPLESTLEPDQCLVMTSVPKLLPEATPAEDESVDDEETSNGDGRGFGPGPLGSLPPTIAAWLLEDSLADTESLVVVYGRPRLGARALPGPTP